MKKLIVGVTGINAVDNPGPGVGVARSLKEDADLHVEIVGLAYDAMEPGIYMDWVVDHSYVMPYPSAGAEAYLDRLLYIKQSRGLDFVIPNLDAELPLFIKLAPILEKHGIGTALPDMARFRLRGKDRLQEVAQGMGIKLPRTRVVTSPEGLVRAAEAIGYPVMVKGIFCRASRAHTVQEAIAHYRALVCEWGHPVIVQEVITGDELNVVGLGDGEGMPLGLMGVKKVSITALGKIWTGVTVKNEPMLAAAERFIHSFKWRGPFELECMICNGDVYLVEINPRFPAWCYFATGVGLNLPARLVRHALGRRVPVTDDYEAGRLFVRYSFELVTDMSAFQRVVTMGETA